jgi:hypothetical protein
MAKVIENNISSHINKGGPSYKDELYMHKNLYAQTHAYI